MLDVPLWGWMATIGAILALIALDFVTVSRHPHEVRLARGGGMVDGLHRDRARLRRRWSGPCGAATPASSTVAGWLLEKSLSVDNLFVFVIIMATFAVPAAYQQRCCCSASPPPLVMRAIFIAVGAALPSSALSVTFLVFGGLLIWTAVQLFRHRDQDPDVEDNPVLRCARRRLPATDQYAGAG